MKRTARKRGETAMAELMRAFDAIRARLDEVDTRRLQDQGQRYAGRLRQRVESRVRPRPRRRLRLGAVILFGTAVGLGYLMYDRSRRDQVRGRLIDVQSRARDRYAQVGGVTGAVDAVMGKVGRNGGDLDEDGLRQQVEQAIGAGGPLPEGLDVAVEGRTVYLRGKVSDPAAIEAAAERAHGVEGVVAVVNLTSTARGATVPGGAEVRPGGPAPK